MTQDLRPHRRHLAVLLATALLLTAVLAAFNAWVDPYGITRRQGMPTAGLPEVTWSRIAAAERMADPSCDVVIIGSSRGVYGFGTRPIDRLGQRLCNGSLGGTSMRELREVARFVARESPAERMILLADMALFHDGRGMMHDYAQSRFNTARTPTTFALWSLTSLSALEDSFATLGVRTPFFDPPPARLPDVQRNRRTVRVTLGLPRILRAFEGPDLTLDLLREVLDEAEARGMQVTLVLPAMHAMEFELYDTAGMWRQHKQWRLWLVQEAAARGLELWDFATYHPPARTKLPLAPDEPSNPWFVDITHQSMLLGELTLDRLFPEPGDATAWDPRFGVRVTPDNVAAHLADLDAGRAQWHAEQPADLAWYEATVRETFARDPAIVGDLARTAATMGQRLPPLPPGADAR